MTELERYNAEINAALGDAARSEDNGYIMGHYSISWVGFFTSVNTRRLIGHIKAWPFVGRVPNDGLPHEYLVGIVRGRGWGRYEPGDYFDIRPPVDGAPITADDLHTPAGRAAIIAEIQDGIHRMCGYVQQVLRGDAAAVPRAPSVQLVPIDPTTGALICPEDLWHVPAGHRIVPSVYVRE